jgi:Bacterial HORMA domain family 1
MSNTFTRSSTFTIAEARKLAAKVEADLYLCSRYYGAPAVDQIPKYAEELAQLLNGGYVEQYEFGFKKDGNRVVSWRYRVAADGSLQSDDRAGRVFSSADVSGATYFNYLWHSAAWSALSGAERSKIETGLPIQRTGGDPPGDGNGYWTSGDKTYSASGVGLGRSTFRPF